MAVQPELESHYCKLADAADRVGRAEVFLLDLASRGKLEVCAFLPKRRDDKWHILGQETAERFRSDQSSQRNLMALVQVAAQTERNKVPRGLEKAPLAALASGQPVHLQRVKAPTDPAVQMHNDPKLYEGVLLGLPRIGPLVECEALYVTAKELKRLHHKLEVPWNGPVSHPALHPEHDFYATELAIALRAWEELSSDPDNRDRPGGARKQIETWLRKNYPKEARVEAWRERIVKVVNWRKPGGALPSEARTKTRPSENKG